MSLLYSNLSQSLVDSWNLEETLAPKILSPIHPVHEIEDVRYHLIDKALLNLYETLPTSGKICIFTYLLKDGKGDANTQNTAYQLLKDRGFTVFCYSIEETDEKPCPKIPNDFLALLETTDLVIEIPTKHPTLEEEIKKLKNPPAYEAIGEYGYFESTTYHPKTPFRSMGLNALEKGIFLKKMPPPLSREETIYRTKKEWLESYPKDHFFSKLDPQSRLNIDYTKTTKGHLTYLNLLLDLLKDSTDNIEVIFFYPYGVLYGYQEGLLCTKGIKQLKVSFKGDTSYFPINSTGKTLHLIHSEKLHQKDFLSLLSTTEDLIGCTGDGSFSEAVSTGKMFYYDALPHKKRFFEDLLYLADYFSPACKDPLKGKNIKKEHSKHFTSLSKAIVKYYQFNPIFLQIAKRALILKKHPLFKEKEYNAIESFKTGNISAVTLLSKVQSLIEENL